MRKRYLGKSFRRNFLSARARAALWVSPIRIRCAGRMRIDSVWGPHTIDLMASRLNKQVDRFYSYRDDPGAATL